MSRVRPQNTYEVDSAVAELAAQQWGVLDLAELRGCGLSANAIASRRRRSLLGPLYRGVYAVGPGPLTMQGRFLAAVKACGPRGVLSHFSAAALWSLLPYEPERAPDVTVPTSGTRCVAGVAVHRTRRPLEAICFNAIRIVTPARALADISPLLTYKPLRRAVREGMALGRVTVDELLGHGSGTLRTMLAEGYVPTRSELEDAVRDLILSGGLAPPDVNRPLFVGGRKLVPDFRWPAERLVVEADSRAWHDHRLAREDDAERQAILEAHGERVVRVTWEQAVARPSQTLARLRAAGVPRRMWVA